MFISQLKNKLAIYDRYGEHRINGLKAVFILELLFLFNCVYTVPNPFFYFFFVPMSAFAAEIAGTCLAEKYLFLFFIFMGSTLAIFLFGLLSVYKLFFIFFVFAYSLWIYFTAIYKIKSMFVPAPLILSIAIYSLIYNNSNSSFYIALNHAMETLVAMLIMFAGLVLFPKIYYLATWRRAFFDVLNDLERISAQIFYNEIDDLPITPGIIIMERYSRMLSRKMKYFSVLKITLLSFTLVTALSYVSTFRTQLQLNFLEVFHSYVKRLRHACHAKEILLLTPLDISELQKTYELRTLHKLILSWNNLCGTV